MTSPSHPTGRTQAPPSTLLQDVIDRVGSLLRESGFARLRSCVEDAVRALDAADLAVVQQALIEAVDLEDRTVRDVFDREGRAVPVLRYRACRAEDAEASWDPRPPSPPIRAIRDAFMRGRLREGELRVEGGQALAAAEAGGRRFVFIGNHESVFDLVVLPWALQAAGLCGLSERLTFFVNPKIFNTPYVNLLVCKPVGIIKVPQNPRIAANESVMDPDEVLRRAQRGFEVAGGRLAAGDSLVIYPEGLRSGGELHRFARAWLDMLRPETLARHGLASDDVLLVPWAHQGVRALEDPANLAFEATVRLGDPIEPARFFAATAGSSRGVAGHVAGYLVARLLPESQRGVYGDDPAAYVSHPHFRQRIREHTLADVRAARPIADAL